MTENTLALRLKKKFISKNFLVSLLSSVFKLILLIGLCFIIIYPLIVKISSVFMSDTDLFDKTVILIPRAPTLANLEFVILRAGYLPALINSVWTSFLAALIQTFICTLIGYGFAKFRFTGNKIMFGAVIFTMLIPPQTLITPMYLFFRQLKILDTFVPVIVLSLTGLAFKNGLYIFMMRQVFKGVPDELSEASTVDGANNAVTFFKIMLPLAGAMMTTMFLLSFSWQWTDTYYSTLLYNEMSVLPNLVSRAAFMLRDDLSINYQGSQASAVLSNTAIFLTIIPLLILYLFAQKRFVQGIESSGIVG